MIVAIPFCGKDYENHILNLKLCAALDHRCDFDCLLAYEDSTPTEAIRTIKILAENYFNKVTSFRYRDAPNPKWPEGPNWAFKNIALHIQEHYRTTHDSFYWWESDCVPLKPGWLSELYTEYKSAKKPFMGHLVTGVLPHGAKHMTGTGIYPSHIQKYLYSTFHVEHLAWDVIMAGEMINMCHESNHLMQHMWTMTPDGRGSLSNDYPPPSFKDWDHVASDLVDFRKCTFHRCKDGSLQRILLDHYNKERGSLDNYAPKMNDSFDIDWAMDRNPPVVELMVCLNRRDRQWLELSVRCFHKFCHGFNGYTAVVPIQDEEVFKDIEGVRIVTVPEEPRTGFLNHMVVKCSFDKYCKEDTTHILSMDPDCMFHTKTTPMTYFKNGLPEYVIRSYKSLREPPPWSKMQATDKDISDCVQWEPVVKNTLGFDPVFYTMCRHPTIIPRNLYKPFRDHVEKVQNKPFDVYVLGQQNEFPQTFCEYGSLGAYFISQHKDSFFWIDCSNGFAPKDHLRNHWARGGVMQDVEVNGEKIPLKKVIESWIN